MNQPSVASQPVTQVEPITLLPQPESHPITPENQPKKSKLTLILLGILVILLIAAGGFFIGKSLNKQESTPQPSTAAPQITSLPTQTTDETADWKTYSDNNLGFLVKYPIKYTPNARSSGVGFNILGENKKNLAGGTDKFFIEKNFAGGWGCLGEISSEEIMIDQIKSKILIQAGMLPEKNCSQIDPDSGHFASVAVNLKETIWFFYYEIDKARELEEIAEFKKILSTFKFLDQAVQSNNPNLATFTSNALGISFTYLKNVDKETFNAKEIGNKVYVYSTRGQPTEGQSVEVFQKNKDETLEQAIKRQFLANKPENDCFVTTYKLPNYYPANFKGAEISYQTSGDFDLEEMLIKSSNCSADYGKTNGIRYFLEDKNNPTKFLFFNIGQYAIISEDNKTWQDTIKIF